MSKVIDFHSHILCGVDHGSRSLETSRSQLKLMKDNGTDIAVATSHFYPERMTLEYFIDKVSSAEEQLVSVASDIGIDVCVGAEVLVCNRLDKLDGLDKLCIKGTNCLLLEIPFVDAWISGAVDTIERIIDNGFVVLLAHIDRYLAKNEREIDRLISRGALAQINASAFNTFGVKKKAMEYVDSGCVYALGSDLHEVDKKAYKEFTSLKKRIGIEEFQIIMSRAEELLANAKMLNR